MSGYIGSKSSVTQVDGYTRSEADAAFATAAQGDLADTAVQPNDNVTLGAVTATSFSGDGSGLTGISSGAGSTEVWAKFSGTTSSISASGNASSITDLGTGRHQVNFTSALSTAAYSCSGHGGNIDSAPCVIFPATLATTYYYLRVQNLSGTNADRDTIFMQVTL